MFGILEGKIKQRTYNNRMGLDILQMIYKKNLLLIFGGGPVSLLSLNIKIVAFCAVVDPLKFPNWVVQNIKKTNSVL